MHDGVTPATILIETYSLSVLADAAGDPAVHARRVPARGRARVGAAAARLPRVLRLDSRRHGGRLRGAVLVLHRVHRRIRA